ncbi:MAG: SH3 domain-containing protein [Chloroflexota bacterium]
MRFIVLLILILTVGLLTACGGPPGAPTAIPASVVRPVQPTPVYVDDNVNFTLDESAQGQEQPDGANPVAANLIAIANAPAIIDNTDGAVVTATPIPDAPPTAMGIVRQGGTLLNGPNQSSGALTTLPAGTSVTVTGRSPDQVYYAVFTADLQAGWMAAGELVIFGAQDPRVVLPYLTTSSAPIALATLLAEAMQPVPLATIDLSSVSSP